MAVRLISIMAFIGMAGSVYGAKLCLSHGQARIISRFGLASFIMAVVFSLSGHVSLLLYFSVPQPITSPS